MPDATASQPDPPPAAPVPSTSDIVIGVPSLNHAGTVAQVLRAAHLGLGEFYSGLSSVVVIADGGSTDGTRDQVRTLRAELPTLSELESGGGHPPAPAGAAKATRTLRPILQKASEQHARACLVLDASLTSMTASWIPLLVHPILEEQFDLVVPSPARHKLEGGIINGIVYPFTRALYGKRMRQPLGSVFALSGRLVDHFLAKQVWDIEATQLATDARATAEAICGGFAVCQTHLGPAERASGGPSPELSSVLAGVLTSVFEEMNRHAAFWQRVRGSESVRWFGVPVEVVGSPAPVDVNRMWESFRLGCRTLQEVWSLVLPPATMLALKYLTRDDAAGPALGDELWARVVYDFAIGYRLNVMNRGHLLRALTPIYLGWWASFVHEMGTASAPEIERRVQQLSLAYEAQKPYLISRWRWPDRFSP